MLQIEKLKPGTTIWLETVINVWKIFLVDSHGLCQVECPTGFDGIKTARLVTHIEREKAFKIKFSDSTLVSSPVISCAIEGWDKTGKRYTYELFNNI